nr:glycoside hydrolase family 57 protein [Candidatus Sigynarchaeota archaeon]
MLHSHIPFCRRSGIWPAGEEWLFEAMNETYLPLLSIFRQFQRENLKPRVMVGIVPVLAEQLADAYMNDRFCEYMEDKIRRAQRDCDRFSRDEAKQAVARYYLASFQRTFDDYKSLFFRNIINSFKWLQEEGIIDVLTSAATHGFLPLLEHDSAVYSQIHVGVKSYEKYFGCKPRGFWLPECAYRPREWSKRENRERRGIDEWLADEGIRFFFVENIGIERAALLDNKNHELAPTTYRGYKLESGVCVFGRNQATGKQVWSPDGGYPGDPYYREFHSKDSESGLQYWRVTQQVPKETYLPAKAMERVQVHADHFVQLLREKAAEASGTVRECSPVIASPYDCELYGHWWHEGPAWIEAVYRRLLKDSQVQCLALDEYIEKYGDTFSTIKMQPSTWGLNGDFTVWQNPEHSWLWPYINGSTVDFENVLRTSKETTGSSNPRESRIQSQMARELLLMEGSDWPFLLFTKQAKEYANQRFHNHHQRFNKLLWAAKNPSDLKRINAKDLKEMEDIDNPWPEIEIDAFRHR